MDWSLTPAAMHSRARSCSYRRRVLGWLAGWFPLSGFGFSRGKRGRGTGREREGERFAFVARLRSGRSGVVLLAFSGCTATGEVATKSESPFTSASTTAMVFTSVAHINPSESVRRGRRSTNMQLHTSTHPSHTGMALHFFRGDSTTEDECLPFPGLSLDFYQSSNHRRVARLLEEDRSGLI